MTSQDQFFARSDFEQSQRIRELELEIQKLRATEQLLKESEAFNHLLLENSRDCIKILDLDGRLIFMNRGGLTTLKIDDFETVRGVVWPNYWRGEHQETAWKAFNQAKTGKIAEFAGCFQCDRTDELRWWSAVLTPIRNSTGNIDRILVFSQEITESRKTREELKESVQALQTLNQLGQAFTAELDLEKLIQAVTDVATKISKAEFGAFFYNAINEAGEIYSLYTLSGAVTKDAFRNFPMPRKTQIFKPTFVGEKVVRSDDITLDPRYGKNPPYHGMPHGHLPVKSYLAVSVISRSGEVLGGVFLGHSQSGVFSEKEEELVKGISSQAAVAIDNARLFQKAQEAIRARDTFLSIASHELKTPLTSMKLQTQIRIRDIRKGNFHRFAPESLPKMLADDEKQLNRLARLVEDMLDLSRLQMGRLPLRSEYFELSSLIQESVDRLESQFENAECSVRIQLSEKIEGSWDRYRLGQVIENLLTNAIKYGAGKPIEIQLSRENSFAKLTVQDFGIGIDQADQERIFAPFERAVSADNFSGMGLGLYITKQIVQAHKGTISVHSRPAEGAVFHVHLPISN